MDKYEYKLRLEEIRTLNKKGRFQEAAQVADTVDWTKVRNVSTLGIISDVYKINRRFEDAKSILLLANEISPQNRRLVYSLCDLTIKMGQVVEAVEFYKEFAKMAPNDNSRYILLYKIYEAQDISLEERIAVLKEYKKREYREKWAYELAFLYHRVGLATECVEECDQLILWFGEGKYVIKAMELKQLYMPLSPAQQQAYDRMTGKRQEAPEMPVQQEAKAAAAGPATAQEGADELDIQVKTMDVGQYNTINLQKALAESMKEVLEPQAQTAGAAATAQDRRSAEKALYGGEDADYLEDVTRVIADSENWDAQATGQLMAEEMPAQAASAAQPQPAADAQPAAAHRPEQMENLLAQEYDGQISLALPEEQVVEKQITGQMNLDQVLAEWERIKADNALKNRQKIQEKVQEQTDILLKNFDQLTKEDMLVLLQRSLQMQQEAKPAPANASARVAMAAQGELENLPEQPAKADPAKQPQAMAQQQVTMPQTMAQPQEVTTPQTMTQPQEVTTPQTMTQPQVATPPQTEEQPQAAAQQADVAQSAAPEAAAIQEEAVQEAPANGNTSAFSAKISEQQLQDHVRGMSKEEKELFAPFVPTKGAMRQLVRALDAISLSAYTGNMIITGAPGSDMMSLAKNVVRSVRASDRNFSGKMARISGEVLNQKNAEELIGKIAGGALLVEKAGKLSVEGAEKLTKALNQEHTGIIVFLMDDKRAINRLTDRSPRLLESFTARFDIAALDSATLVKYGCQYAYNLEYAIDELGRLALHTRIEDMQTSDHAVTVEEVREIVEEAIDHAERKRFSHFVDILLRKRYDEDDMIILKERDFI